MRDTGTDGHAGADAHEPSAPRNARIPDSDVLRWPHFRSPVPDPASCECGEALKRCPGCRELRCLWCDPITSDDCRWGI